ncbi:hypothetical protein FACS1894190_06040 [Spirochaetia bacterium]|nr:hypothetical protein FACS1894190_06040 [Spirochaetia bacterium]
MCTTAGIITNIMKQIFCTTFLLISVSLFAQNGETGTLLDMLKSESGGVVETPEAPSTEEFDKEEFDEEEFLDSYNGPIVDVIHDNRSGSQFVRVYTENEDVEYHYLNQMYYSDLIFVLTDLLKRITDSGYIWASDLEVEYAAIDDDPAIIYKVDKPAEKAFGIVQFPQFRISISGTKTPTEANKYDSSKGNILAGLMMQFVYNMAFVEESLHLPKGLSKTYFKTD